MLSFAGAQRDYVSQVAEALRARRVRCFYDADEQIDLWGKHLAEEPPTIYGERAAAVVLFISAEYVARDWTRATARHRSDGPTSLCPGGVRGPYRGQARRRIRILGAPPVPTASWVILAVRNLVMNLNDAGSGARFLIHDRDGKFPAVLG